MKWGWFVLLLFLVGLWIANNHGYLDEFIADIDKNIADRAASEMTCEGLAPDIIEMSQKDQNPFSPKILKLYDIQESIQKEANQILVCTAEARWDRGENSNIKFHEEKDRDGQHFIGYKPIGLFGDDK